MFPISGSFPDRARRRRDAPPPQAGNEFQTDTVPGMRYDDRDRVMFRYVYVYAENDQKTMSKGVGYLIIKMQLPMCVIIVDYHGGIEIRKETHLHKTI